MGGRYGGTMPKDKRLKPRTGSNQVPPMTDVAKRIGRGVLWAAKLIDQATAPPKAKPKPTTPLPTTWPHPVPLPSTPPPPPPSSPTVPLAKPASNSIALATTT